jgi:polyphosphate kinase 2 (PPK2 family)
VRPPNPQDDSICRSGHLHQRHSDASSVEALEQRFELRENDTTILKFFLYISKEEQLARFKERLDDPARQWKISNSDYAERDLWGEYIDAFETALSESSTKYAPWFVIPANHKWFRNLAVSQIIADALNDMNLELPKPTVDLKEIRRLYHKDAAAL